MSDFDLLGIGLFAAAVLLLPALTAWLATRKRLRAVERRLLALDGQLGVFTEASIELARTVGQPLVQPPETVVPEASRRYVLHRAMDRVQDGEDVGVVLRELGVMGDERRLLEMACRVRRNGRLDRFKVAQ